MRRSRTPPKFRDKKEAEEWASMVQTWSVDELVTKLNESAALRQMIADRLGMGRTELESRLSRAEREINQMKTFLEEVLRRLLPEGK